MKVTVLREAGCDEALLGLSLSYDQPIENMPKVADKLARKNGGHNKFLESIMIWVEVQAPRFWWQEGDTYRISTKQSESTMHTLVKELQLIFSSEQLDDYVRNNFDGGFLAITPETIRQMHFIANDVGIDDEVQRLVTLKRMMPEGFLQKRMWCFSYKTFRNMVLQRMNHRLPH